MEPEEEEEEEPRGAEEEEEGAEPSTGVTLKHTRNGLRSLGLRTASDWQRELTWGHRGQRSWGRRVRSGTPGSRSLVGSCTAWDWLPSGAQQEALQVHYGGCSRSPDSGMLGNAEGSWAP